MVIQHASPAPHEVQLCDAFIAHIVGIGGECCGLIGQRAMIFERLSRLVQPLTGVPGEMRSRGGATTISCKRICRPASRASRNVSYGLLHRSISVGSRRPGRAVRSGKFALLLLS